VPTFGGFDSDFRLGFFTGSPMAAQLDTGRLMHTPNRRTFVRGARVITDAANHTLRFGSSPKHGEDITMGAQITPNSIGVCDKRIAGLLHQYRLEIAAGEDWSQVNGIEPDAIPEGLR
jgi:hypothetical protein